VPDLASGARGLRCPGHRFRVPGALDGVDSFAFQPAGARIQAIRTPERPAGPPDATVRLGAHTLDVPAQRSVHRVQTSQQLALVRLSARARRLLTRHRRNDDVQLGPRTPLQVDQPARLGSPVARPRPTRERPSRLPPQLHELGVTATPRLAQRPVISPRRPRQLHQHRSDNPNHYTRTDHS
jgi:hypothetical protein